MRLNLAAVKAGRIPQALSLCPTDSRFVAFLNEAQQRILKRGTWWGCYGKYRICADSGCITWPRQIATILSASVCEYPIQVRNEWFEFLEYGWGMRGDDSTDLQLIDRGGQWPVFADITGTNKRVRVSPTIASSLYICIQGYDENGTWIRTSYGGAQVDGEYVQLNNVAGTLTTRFFTSITAVIKPVTTGFVRLYEYNNDTAVERQIAYYEPDETLPAYRRSFIPGIACLSTDSDCDTVTVTVMAKLEYIPVVNDPDWLIVQNEPALKDMCMSIQLAESGKLEESEVYDARAIREMESELKHYLGDGTNQPIRIQTCEFGGNIEGVI